MYLSQHGQKMGPQLMGRRKRLPATGWWWKVKLCEKKTVLTWLLYMENIVERIFWGLVNVSTDFICTIVSMENWLTESIFSEHCRKHVTLVIIVFCNDTEKCFMIIQLQGLISRRPRCGRIFAASEVTSPARAAPPWRHRSTWGNEGTHDQPHNTPICW